MFWLMGTNLKQISNYREKRFFHWSFRNWSTEQYQLHLKDKATVFCPFYEALMIFQLQIVNARSEEQYEVGYPESHSVFTSKKETEENNSEFMWVAHRFKWKIFKELLGKFQGDLVFIDGHAFCKIITRACMEFKSEEAGGLGNTWSKRSGLH